MGMSDITTEIKFGASAAVSRDQIKQAKFNILRSYQTRAAEDMGRKIAESKGWQLQPNDDMAVSTLNVYVFKPTELRDFVEAKIKTKLVEMSQREGVSEEVKTELMNLSERI